MTKELTINQRRTLQFIHESLQDKGYPPTVREINQAVGLSGPCSVKKVLDSLERKGHIRRRARHSRAIELTEPLLRRADIVRTPLVGRVRAGQPTPAVEDIEDYYDLDTNLCRCENPFLLRVQGDSMQDAHITDQDLVLVRPQDTAENGDIVVALIEDEATVKRFFRERDRIVLKPENSSMSPIVISEADGVSVTIAGKVTAVLRRL